MFSVFSIFKIFKIFKLMLYFNLLYFFIHFSFELRDESHNGHRLITFERSGIHLLN